MRSLTDLDRDELKDSTSRPRPIIPIRNFRCVRATSRAVTAMGPKARYEPRESVSMKTGKIAARKARHQERARRLRPPLVKKAKTMPMTSRRYPPRVLASDVLTGSLSADSKGVERRPPGPRYGIWTYPYATT